jgi:DNA-binding NarL/FixJ family response regulator
MNEVKRELFDQHRCLPTGSGSEVAIPLHTFYKLFVSGEARFLLACLSRNFNPSFIYVGTSNLEYMLTYKAIKVHSDFLGAASSTAHAIALLQANQPGFVFIHERGAVPTYAELLDHLSQSPQFVKSFVFIDSVEVLDKFPRFDADVIVADRDLFLPVNPFAQGLMALIAGTTYRSPSIAEYFQKSSCKIDRQSTRHLVLGLRDQQLLEAYVLGLSNREIADQLNLSVRTVQTYSGNLLARLGVNNRQKALLSIAKMGISVVPRFFRR